MKSQDYGSSLQGTDSEDFDALAKAAWEQLRHEGARPETLDDSEIYHSELKLQNAALRDSRERLERQEAMFERLFDAAPVGYFVVDFNGIIQRTNEEGASLARGVTVDPVGVSSARLFRETDRARFVEARDEARETGERCSVEVTLNDERATMVVVNMSYLQGLVDGTDGWLMVLTDVSVQRRTEREAERIRRLIGETHHRVKNHFQFASSLLELKKPRERSDSVSAILSDSQARLSALAALHDTLHQYSAHREVEIHAYIERVCSSLLQIYNTDQTVGIDLSLEQGAQQQRRLGLDMQSAVVTGTAISELVSNAVKDGLESHGRVSIRIVVEEDGEHHVRVRVEDDGPGLPPDFRMPDGIHSGLGLVSELIRDSLGSELVATNCGTSVPDEKRCTLGGACFAFTVPLASG
ncbi:MAG: sensor histidine kinase [Spirochaetales bacterium]